jgi:hypothetical protein
VTLFLFVLLLDRSYRLNGSGYFFGGLSFSSRLTTFRLSFSFSLSFSWSFTFLRGFSLSLLGSFFFFGGRNGNGSNLDGNFLNFNPLFL